MHRFESDGIAGHHARDARGRIGFVRSEDGSLIIFGLMVFLMMLIVGGLGVDLMRYETQRTRLQSTLDRAVLAAASMDQTLEPEDVVLDYFRKAGLSQFIDASMIDVYENDRLLDENFAGVDDAELTSRRVEASAQMTMGTTFLKFSGIDWLGAPAAGTAEESASLTEISLVLDVSGSMGWSSASGRSKIYELREAAKKFINIVLCDPSHPDRTSPCVVEPGKVSVNIVPYASHVLVGETLLGYFDPSDEHDYSSCVDFDADDFSTTAVSPSVEIQRAGHIDPRPMNYRDSRYYDVYEPIEHLRTCQTESYREITAVSGNASDLRSHIDDLEAAGATSIELGMKWGAALLDPAAESVVDELIDAGETDDDYEGRPLAWNTRGVSKVVVLMTDGENTEHYELYDDFYDGASPVWRTNDEVRIDGDWQFVYSIYDVDNDRYYWEHTREWQDHAYGTGTYEECERVWVSTGRRSGYWTDRCEEVEEGGNGAAAMDYADLWNVKPWVWYQQFDWLETPGYQVTTSQKNARLAATCAAAKAKDITVFSIGFEVPNNSASLSVMKNCATSDAHYFDADGLDLSASFASIAREITKLRLTN